MLKCMSQKWDGRDWAGFMWLRIRTSDRLLWSQYWTFGFHRMQGVSQLVDKLTASQKGLCSMQLVTATIPILVLQVRQYTVCTQQPKRKDVYWNKAIMTSIVLSTVTSRYFTKTNFGTAHVLKDVWYVISKIFRKCCWLLPATKSSINVARELKVNK